jgi:PAS domain S-box-containing protein
VDRQGIIQRVNRRECELRGLAKRDLVRKRCTDLLPPEDRQRHWQQIERRMSGKVALVPYQTTYIRPNGSTVTVEVHEQLLSDSAGYPMGMRIATIDITQRKQSEAEAHQSASELRVLFQGIPDLFARLDGDGNVLDCSGGRSSDPFLSPKNFAGRRLQDILIPEVLLQFRLAQDKARKTGEMQIVEFGVENHQGGGVYETRLLTLNWDEWIAIIRNITVRRRNERKLKEYAQQLERKNEELHSALVTAREATVLKSQFLANMSHEIRTPMNGVVGMTSFLLETSLTAEQQEYAESIRRSADALLTLINDILDLSKIESGKLRVDRVPFSVEALVEETTSILGLQARAKGLEFACAILPGLPPAVAGDPGRLRQVLTNLIGNAIKFTDQGRIHLNVELLSEMPPGMLIRFNVKDTGIGISPDQTNRLFQSFTQGDGSSTRRYGGTGLGLAISKQLVELLGGEIGVESEPGKGSHFWFTAKFDRLDSREAVEFQQAAGQAAQLRKKSSADAIAPKPPPPGVHVVKLAGLLDEKSQLEDAARRVLLAEDNEINQRIAVRLLQKLGVAVDFVSNGREAVEAVANRKYDLVFMDCQMPGMDGFEATRIIRTRQGNTDRTPICALTANAMEGDRERCLAAGMDDYISKPVGIEKLQDVIDRWIQPRGIPFSEPSTIALSPGIIKAVTQTLTT